MEGRFFGTYAITGTALLTGRFVPLALTVPAPVIVNIVAVHLFLAPSGFPLTILVVALELFLAWSYRGVPLVAARAHNEVSSRELARICPSLSGAPNLRRV
jgi:hypothetical protein